MGKKQEQDLHQIYIDTNTHFVSFGNQASISHIHIMSLFNKEMIQTRSINIS